MNNQKFISKFVTLQTKPILMKIFFNSFLLAALILSVSCKKYDASGHLIKDYDELNRATWLLGDWEYTDSIGKLTENWKVQDDSTFVGNSFFVLVNEKDTIHRETLQLQEDKELLIYLTSVKGQNNEDNVPFQLTSKEDSLLVFKNPKHDYPQKIQYELLKNSRIKSSLYGNFKGKKTVEIYLFSKKK
ncbi:MAG: hypothetical protein ACI9XR_001477 [Flavobacterium sp.]|jgi:hypothetical protein